MGFFDPVFSCEGTHLAANLDPPASREGVRAGQLITQPTSLALPNAHGFAHFAHLRRRANGARHDPAKAKVHPARNRHVTPMYQTVMIAAQYRRSQRQQRHLVPAFLSISKEPSMSGHGTRRLFHYTNGLGFVIGGKIMASAPTTLRYTKRHTSLHNKTYSISRRAFFRIIGQHNLHSRDCGCGADANAQ